MKTLNTTATVVTMIFVGIIAFTITRYVFTAPVIERHTYYLMPDESCQVEEMHLKIIKAQ